MACQPLRCLWRKHGSYINSKPLSCACPNNISRLLQNIYIRGTKVSIWLLAGLLLYRVAALRSLSTTDMSSIGVEWSTNIMAFQKTLSWLDRTYQYVESLKPANQQLLPSIKYHQSRLLPSYSMPLIWNGLTLDMKRILSFTTFKKNIY